MAVQTTYASNFAPGYAGMIANTETRNVISRTVQDAALPFGVPVFQGATDNSVTATPGTPFVGFSVASKSVRPSATPDSYAHGDAAGILTLGVIFATVSHSVTVGEPGFVTPAGGLSDVSAGDTALPGVSFDSSGAANSLVKVRLG